MKKYFSAFGTTIMSHTATGCRHDSQVHRLALIAGFSLLAVGVVLPVKAMAGEISGHIYIDSKGPVPAGKNLYVTFQGIRLHSTVRANGWYRFVLPPGSYIVWYCDRERKLWSGSIYSLQRQAKQDIQLKQSSHEHC